MRKELSKAIALFDVVLPVASKNHIDDRERCHARFLLYAEEAVLFEFANLLLIALTFHIVECCNQKTTCTASGVVHNVVALYIHYIGGPSRQMARSENDAKVLCPTSILQKYFVERSQPISARIHG